MQEVFASRGSLPGVTSIDRLFAVFSKAEQSHHAADSRTSFSGGIHEVSRRRQRTCGDRSKVEIGTSNLRTHAGDSNVLCCKT